MLKVKLWSILIGVFCVTLITISNAYAVCTSLWAPVCGINGVTYSNAGCAADAGVAVAYDGECDNDGDGVVDHLDICPGYDDNIDTDGDGIPDGCDYCPGDIDSDNDTICDAVDNCPNIANQSQTDSDNDGIGNPCDPQTCGNSIPEVPEACDDGNADNWDSCANNCTLPVVERYIIDPVMSGITTSGGLGGGGIGDLGITGSFDLVTAAGQMRFTNHTATDIPTMGFTFPEYPGSYDGTNFSATEANGSFPENTFSGMRSTSYGTVVLELTGDYHQPYYDGIIFHYSVLAALDTDADGYADMIDEFPADPTEWVDSDNDGVGDNSDLCQGNDAFGDIDGDGICSDIDICIGDNATGDSDNDGFCANVDNCPAIANPDQSDANGNGIGDICDAEAPGRGNVIDAPHNSTNSISCIDCHTYSLWWQYSPTAEQHDALAFKQITNTVCLACHDTAGTSMPAALHASAILGEKYGIWDEHCTKCHDPHFQAQLDWLGSVADSDLYLATGIIDNVTLIGDTSVIDYTLSVSNPNWADTALWSNKSGKGNGLVFVRNTATAGQTFMVVDADLLQITVKGRLTSFSAGESFGLIYGQQIRKAMMTGSGLRAVKFFDPAGPFGLTNNEPTPSGLCQVCHIQTTYWREDGSGTAHGAGVTCTACHIMAEGFGAPPQP